MIELNVDRLLFGIGALLIGALMVAGVIQMYPEVMTNWGFTMADSVSSVDVADSQPIRLVNGSFTSGSDGWSRTGDVRFTSGSDGFAHIPADSSISTVLNVPEGASDVDVQVSFRAKGEGDSRIILESRGSERVEESIVDFRLFEDYSTYRKTLKGYELNDSKLTFESKSNADMKITDIEVLYLTDTD